MSSGDLTLCEAEHPCLSNDRDDSLRAIAPRRVAAAGFGEPRDEVVRRRVGRPTGIDEPNSVRQAVVAKRARDAGAVGDDRVRRVQLFRLVDLLGAVANK